RMTMLPIPVSPRLLRAARRLPRLGDRLEHALGALAVPVLRVPLDADDATVRIKLDAEITNKALIQEVGDLALARLPEGPWAATHRPRELVIELKHPKRPPASVWYTAEANQQYAIDDVPIAKKAGDEWVTLPLKRLTPHVVVSASTGWGKTTVANVYIAHTAGNGGKLLVNDPKRIGYLRA
ncbi:P-loop NTPase family protein, partial [Couchioplanes azureus]